jgi:anti-sigma regulatory factor (Ser/Thr protein kinase)
VAMATAERAWCVVVPHHALGAQQARRRLAAELSDVISQPRLADVIAVAAELVGNAIRHASPLPGGVVRVAWRIREAPTGRIIEVRVTDGGAAQVPQPRHAAPDELDGRGLTIIAALADRWGVDRDGLGQSVWAELSA